MLDKWKGLKERLYEIGVELGVRGILAGLDAASVLVWVAGSAALGALAGEIVDHIPYLNYAIPKSLEEILKTNYFYGNLDKLGATLGFIGGYFKGIVDVKKEELKLEKC